MGLCCLGLFSRHKDLDIWHSCQIRYYLVSCKTLNQTAPAKYAHGHVLPRTYLTDLPLVYVILYPYQEDPRLVRLVYDRILLRLNHLIVVSVLMMTTSMCWCWGWCWGRFAIISSSGSGRRLIWCSIVRTFFGLLTNRSFNF